MASVDECRAALDKLGEQFGDLDQETRTKHVVNRRLSCHITDLDVTFHGRVHQDGLDPFTETAPADGRSAEVRIRISSDDLLSMVNGELDMARALLSGRVKIDASLGDLLRLRKLL
ncbi:SCP2 sterol-binding domain-containing protein [Sphaerisporangium corydalis]|uniref:SCP2 sterol-binding domain-containing protein n=1 Tax=Sphaerisporangium corydalis TaxID=1441875 RepID=A0ABV9ERU8_9ACTN|nr:SCP2 sterol-binding domain-containing protein [Sphaerisporangium corydalis]